jgi:hypothetical protein
MKWNALLKQYRKKYGFQSAKEFFNFLVSRGLSCNYPYFMKLEKGLAIPSAQVLSQIASGLEVHDGDELVLSYCRELLPKHDYLFQNQNLHFALTKKKKSDHQRTVENLDSGTSGQIELTLRQVHFLGSEQINYHIFVLLTLARQGIPIADLQKHFGKDKFNFTFKKMIEYNIAYTTENKAFAMQSDIRFPKSDLLELKKIYHQFDVWDETIGDDFHFEEVITKMFLRRISVRYLGLIQKNLELLFETVKSSDETDKRYNQTVIQLKIHLKKGTLPG